MPRPRTRFVCPFSDEGLETVQVKNGEYQVVSPYGWRSRLYKTAEEARAKVLLYQRKPHQIRKIKSEGGSRFVIFGRGWWSKPFQTYEGAQRWAAHSKGFPVPGEYKPASKISVSERLPPEEDALADVRTSQKAIYEEQMELSKDWGIK